MLSLFRKSLMTVAAALVVALTFMTPPAHAGAMSNYLVNKEFDWIIRGQAYTPPTTEYVALATSAGSTSACGTEVSGGSYARVGVTSALNTWSGTQGATTTAVSSGSSGQISNNTVITFPAPTAAWGSVVEFCWFDAPTGGNLLWRASLTVSKTINSGDAAPAFAVSALTWTIN